MGTRIIFVTGTDTGVGKTLMTALLLRYLRDTGCKASALKPFCSGTREDAEILHRLQDAELSLDEVNPFYFPEPVAPLVSARRHKSHVSLEKAVTSIHAIANRLALTPPPKKLPRTKQKVNQSGPNFLLIEGSGGLLVPLGEGYTVLDLISRLDCEVVVVSRNKLGTINHTLLTVRALLDQRPRRERSSSREAHPKGVLKLRSVVLMESAHPDVSSRSTPALLPELLAPVPLVGLPFLGPLACSPRNIQKNARKFKDLISRVVA